MWARRTGAHRERRGSRTLSWETPLTKARVSLSPRANSALWNRETFTELYRALQPHVMSITDIGAPQFSIQAAKPTTEAILRTTIATVLGVTEEEVQCQSY